MIALVLLAVFFVLIFTVYGYTAYRIMQIEDRMHMARLRYHLKLPPR